MEQVCLVLSADVRFDPGPSQFVAPFLKFYSLPLS